MPPSKNPTAWQPATGKGSVVTPGTAFLVDQSGNFLRDQSGNFLVTTPSYVTGLNPTAWTAAPAK